MKKTILAINTLLVLIFVVACASPAQIVVSSPTPIDTGALPSPVITTDVPPADPGTSFVPLIKIKVGFIDPIRVIPADFDPSAQAAEIISQYQQILSSESEIWYGGTVTGSHTFSLSMSTLSQDPAERVKLQFPIHLIISRTEEPAEGVNIIHPVGGGGGGEALAFPGFDLKIGEMDLIPDNDMSFDLQANNSPSITLDFTVTCKETGVYKMEFSSIPYTVTNSEGTNSASSYYIISLVCPHSLTQWPWYGDTQLNQSIPWIFENGQYIQQP